MLAAAPPHAGHGKRSRGAVSRGQGDRVPALFAAGGASRGFQGFCQGGEIGRLEDDDTGP